MWFQKAKITVNLGEESEAYKHRNYIGTQPPVKRHNKAVTTGKLSRYQRHGVLQGICYDSKSVDQHFTRYRTRLPHNDG